MDKVIKNKRVLELVTSHSSGSEKVQKNSESVERNGKNFKKFEYLENEKSFFDKMKNIFYSEGLSFG